MSTANNSVPVAPVAIAKTPEPYLIMDLSRNEVVVGTPRYTEADCQPGNQTNAVPAPVAVVIEPQRQPVLRPRKRTNYNDEVDDATLASLLEDSELEVKRLKRASKLHTEEVNRQWRRAEAWQSDADEQWQRAERLAEAIVETGGIIFDYKAKIATLKSKLAGKAEEHLGAVRREEMLKAQVTALRSIVTNQKRQLDDNEVERWRLRTVSSAHVHIANKCHLQMTEMKQQVGFNTIR
jgi:hypothetical protein